MPLPLGMKRGGRIFAPICHSIRGSFAGSRFCGRQGMAVRFHEKYS